MCRGGGASRSLKAFTLAEVLITLAIIGVVAALTIPTLITNYQKQQYVTQLKKSITTLNNGFRTIMANEGVTNLADTTLWRKAPDEVNSADTSEFTQEFSKHFKVLEAQATSDKIKERNIKGLNGKPWENETYNMPYFHFADGSTISLYVYRPMESSITADEIKAKGGKIYQQLGQVFLDVNGEQGPNTIGRDIFQLMIAQNGNLYPVGGNDFLIYGGLSRETYHWSGTNKAFGCRTDGADYRGQACAARIIEEGWQMTY